MNHRYLLDTNVLSDLVRHPDGAAARKVATVGAETVCTSIVVACEARYGAAKKRSARLTKRIEQLLDALDVLALEPDTDAHYAAIRCALEAAGTPIGANDLMIAAHTMAVGATLVTDNVNEFSRVPGLVLENWLDRTAERGTPRTQGESTDP